MAHGLEAGFPLNVKLETDVLLSVQILEVLNVFRSLQ
jgi:hypothetical protein